MKYSSRGKKCVVMGWKGLEGKLPYVDHVLAVGASKRTRGASPLSMNRSIAIAAAAAALVAAAPAAASPRLIAPRGRRRVHHGHQPGRPRRGPAGLRRPPPAGRPLPSSACVRLRPGQSLRAALAALRSRPDVEWAVPNYVARATQTAPPPATTPPPAPAPSPDDPGTAGVPGGWQGLQWNFLPGNGVDAPGAWANLQTAGRARRARRRSSRCSTPASPTATRGRFRRSPDFAATHFVRGYDFVAHDAFPNDQNGHGTHVAGHDRRVDQQRRRRSPGWPRARRSCPCACSTPAARATPPPSPGASASPPATGAQRHQPQPRVLDARCTASADPRDHRRARATPGARAWCSSAPRATRPTRRSPIPAKREPGDLGGRDHRARLPGRVLQRRPGPGHRRARAAAPTRALPGETQLRAAGPPGRDIYQLTFTGSVRRFGLPPRLRGHLDGRAARGGDRRAGDRQPRPGPQADARARSPRAWRRPPATSGPPATTPATAGAWSTPPPPPRQGGPVAPPR